MISVVRNQPEDDFGGLTVTLQMRLTPSTFTVMVAFPFFRAMIRPLSSTLAIADADERKVSGRFEEQVATS